jgi:Cu+-exporting ATPase
MTNSEKHTFKISGMTCASCVSHVEKALMSIDGVASADVNLATDEARVEVNGTSVKALISAVEKAGYYATLDADSDDASDLSSDHPTSNGHASFKSDANAAESEFKKKFRIGLPLAFAVFVLEMGPMAFGGQWMEFTHQNLLSVNLVKLLLTAVVLFYSGSSFFTRAWKVTKLGTADMNSLVAVGTGAAFFFSAWAVFFGSSDGLISNHDVYFDTAAVIIALVLLGRWMEEKARNNTRDTLKGLLELAPKVASRLISINQFETIPLKDVRSGDVLMVKAYESLPVDGTLVSESAIIDEAMMTGESMPTMKSKGDKLVGGTRNSTQTFMMKATKVGKETALAAIIDAVKTAQGSKAPIQRLVDKIAAVFVPIVMIIALFTVLVWLYFGTPQQAIVNMVAVMVIACPCALGLATPTAIMVGSGRAAEKGILIKEAVTLEQAKSIDTIIFDKTGTLTTGIMQLSQIRTAGNIEENEILRLVASVEQGSDHPIAKSILLAAQERQIHIDFGLQIETRAGVGISGIVGSQVVEIGSIKLLNKESDSSWIDHASYHQKKGQIPLVVLIDKKVEALLFFEDEIRAESEMVIDLFKSMNIDVVMLTGDQPDTAQAVANKLGISIVEAGVSPVGKSDIVRKYQSHGKKVAMVGDGINDAAALTQSDLGIAMSGGSDLAVSSADITIVGDHLMNIPESLKLSKSVLRVIHQNLFWAFAYNTLGIPLAALGFLNPMLAGAAMALSSVSVVTNSLRIKRM